MSDLDPAIVEALNLHRQEHRPDTGASVCRCGEWEGPYTWLPPGSDRAYAMHLADTLAPLIAAAVDAARAEAWDEGYERASHDCGPWQYRETPNPYLPYRAEVTP